jgi:hypothetical protein
MNQYVSLSLTSRKSSFHLHALYSPRAAVRTFTPRRDLLVICGQYLSDSFVVTPFRLVLYKLSTVSWPVQPSVILSRPLLSYFIISCPTLRFLFQLILCYHNLSLLHLPHATVSYPVLPYPIPQRTAAGISQLFSVCLRLRQNSICLSVYKRAPWALYPSPRALCVLALTSSQPDAGLLVSSTARTCVLRSVWVSSAEVIKLWGALPGGRC